MSHDALIGPVPAPGLHVMTYNIRRRIRPRRGRNQDLWTGRRWLLRRLLTVEGPAVLGVQEALPDQVDWLLAGLGPDYCAVGHGRNADGSGEGTPILYDGRRLRLTGWSQQALSNTPDQPGSRSWGNLVPRIVVSADFTDVETRARFRVLNMHLDHLSPQSRLQSARMLRQLVERQPGPTVLMGDANTGLRSRPFRELTAGGLLRDAWVVGERRLTERWGTFSNYRPPRRGRCLDWILVNEGIAVGAVGINAARFDGAAASDHEPVQAVLTIAR